jgi:hypothetical protein
VTTFTSPYYPPGPAPWELDRDHYEACEDSPEDECICLTIEAAARDSWDGDYDRHEDR